MNLQQDILTILRMISQVKMTKKERQVFVELMHNKLILNNEHILLAEINYHRLQYLFFKHLKDCHCLFDTISKKSIIALSEQFAFLQIKHREYLESIKPIIDKLDFLNIPYALIKGIYLLDSIYKNDNEYYRTYGDVDLLVAKQNVKQIGEILESNGYIQGEIDENYNIVKSSRKNIIYWSLTSHQEHKYIKGSACFGFSPRLVLCVDLNTTIFDGGLYEMPISTEDILGFNVQKSENEVMKYNTLNPTMGLLQLCYHFYKDTKYESKKKSKEDFSLIKFCDIREYINRNFTNIQWNEFFDLIKSAGIQKEILFVLNMVFEFYKDKNIKDILIKYQQEKPDSNINFNRMLIHLCED